ncbi:unnamed protein product [Owenia fusiformis]|uniref:RZZ complex subunit KNTC1/ROD C-terminal domain-containing protein n=1 Tax=Owenia fusiformis TaxID=6347 RepID=A0A8S4PH78_OWEFU|nr:unnamed protein product [Owenia fusiformis]
MFTDARADYELYDNVPCADTGEVLYRVAHIFCQLLAKEEGEDNLTTKDLEMLPSHIKLLASQAVTVCKPELICDCLELSKCASLADSLSKQSEIGDYGISVQRVSEDLHDASNLDPYTTWTFDKHFKEDGLVLDSSLILPLAYQYTIASLPSSEKLPHPYQQNRIQGVSRQQQIKKSQQANQKTPEAAPFTLSTVGVKIVDHLRENSLLELCAHYSIDAVSSILQHIATQSMGFPISDQDMLGVIEKEKDLGMQALLRSQGIIQDITVALISKMVSHRVVDHNLVLGNLYTLSAKGALNTLRSHSTKPGNSYKRIMYLSRIGIDLSVLLKDEKALKTCKALQVNATWGHRLSTLGIQFKEVFNGPSEHKEKILPSIVQHAEGSISLVTEYCRDFNLDPNKALCLFLDNLLHHPTGDTYSHKQMLDKVEIVIKEISDKEDLLLRLKDIYMKIDAYNYESLGFVLEQINKLSTSADIQKSLKLLEYLNDYVRQAPPSEYEKSFQPISEDDVLMYGNNNLPPQAETRLPFHLFMKAPWKIITPELNAGTVDAFVSIATLLQLQLDTVYITTIQNTIDSHITSVKQQDNSGSAVIEKANCNWNVKNDINVKMFATLKRLILCIDSCVNALGVAQYVVKALPMGPEKVWALYLAAHLAEKWLQSEKPGTPQYEQAKISTKKFTDLHRRMATEEILYKNSLGEKEFLALTGSPAKLIFQLYSHDSILRRSNAGNLDKFPDIHKVAEDISVLHKVNLQKVHLNLLEKWLHASKDLKQQEDADATMTFNVNFDVEEAVAENTGEMSEDEKNLRRVTYVLKYGKVQDNVLFLLNFTFKENSSRTTNMCRVRALRCLFNIADLETIEQIYKNPIDKIKNEMKCLLYLVELEKLRLNHTKASFAKCNKEGLVRGIWRNHSHERSAVRLVSDLCLDYKIYDVHLWNGVLQQLLAFNMMQYLEHVLVCLSGIPELWQVPCIEKMWKTVLLQHSEPTALLQRCPLLLDMPLDQILDKH